ncbi:MAG TPA: hypothetical protein VHN80_12595, partial [Kineosporiaceae bacterium]|nr:hypothetical protein [Kineosporiaceae bacterium]
CDDRTYFVKAIVRLLDQSRPAFGRIRHLEQKVRHLPGPPDSRAIATKTGVLNLPSRGRAVLAAASGAAG